MREPKDQMLGTMESPLMQLSDNAVLKWEETGVSWENLPRTGMEPAN